MEFVEKEKESQAMGWPGLQEHSPNGLCVDIFRSADETGAQTVRQCGEIVKVICLYSPFIPFFKCTAHFSVRRQSAIHCDRVRVFALRQTVRRCDERRNSSHCLYSHLISHFETYS